MMWKTKVLGLETLSRLRSFEINSIVIEQTDYSLIFYHSAQDGGHKGNVALVIYFEDLNIYFFTLDSMFMRR